MKSIFALSLHETINYMKHKMQMPDCEVFAAKIDWWIYLIAIVAVGVCIAGPLIDKSLFTGAIIGCGILALCLLTITGVKYEIRGNQLGIRNFYRWTWIPVDQIKTVEQAHGVAVQGAVSAVLSLDRVRMTLFDRNVLKSTMPVDIAPKNPAAFIARLKEINPDIIVK